MDVSERFEGQGFEQADGAEARRRMIEDVARRNANSVEALEVSKSPEKGEGLPPGAQPADISPQELPWPEGTTGAEPITDEWRSAWQGRFDAIEQVKNVPRDRLQSWDRRHGLPEEQGFTGVQDQFLGKDALVVTRFPEGLRIEQGHDIAYAAKRLNVPSVPGYVQ